MQITAWRQRLEIDTAQRYGVRETLNRSQPFWWNGTALQFELGLFFKGSIIDNLANLVSIRIDVKPEIAGDASLTKVIGAGDFANPLPTAEEWNTHDPEKCHAKARFTSEENELDLNGASERNFWVIVSATDENGDVITLGVTQAIVAEDGSDAEPATGAGERWRFHEGYPELKFADNTWHRLDPVIMEEKYSVDIRTAASPAISDSVASKWRLNDGYPELLWPDETWHRLLPVIMDGKYALDVDQDESTEFTEDSTHFRVNLTYPELHYEDTSWHRMRPVMTAGVYYLDIEQGASL